MNDKIGKKWAVEWREYEDPWSGAEITQLTDYNCHSYHLYFTNPGWYANGKKLLFGSERENQANLFSIDLESGEITQLTDFITPRGTEFNFLSACVNPVKEEAYFYHERHVKALDLNSFELTSIYTLPEKYVKSMLNCTADGKHVLMGLYENLSDKIRVDLERGYVGFREIHQARPHSMIVQIPSDGNGEAEIVWEEDYWIGHVNTSPSDPALLTFCHEGPWTLVDNRIWGFNLKNRDAWKIRPREGKENPGHEYWFADGSRVGYHGSEGKENLIGSIKPDNTDKIEVRFPSESGHIHSNDEHLIVGDAGQHVRLWRWNENEQVYEGPHALCEHRCSKHIQKLHVHPRLNPEGTHVLYTSDISGYGNVYLAKLPPASEFEELPFLFFTI